jgi:hypothetical protein
MRFAIDTRVLTVLATLVAGPTWAQTPVQKVQLVPPGSLTALSWQSVASDPQGDTKFKGLPDAKTLSYAIDPKTDTLWFKVDVHDPLPERFFGLNIVIDADDQPDNGMAWMGTNKLKFDRLASAYLFKGEGYWQGVLGVTDSAAAGKTVFDSISKSAKASIDPAQRVLLIGVPRSALGAVGPTIRVVGTVGSTLVGSDDIPNEGAAVVKLTP